MAPRIQYARRPDGARTAYAVMGEGPVLVMPPGGQTTIEWYTGDIEANERFCNRLAAHRTLVLYDRHGCGLSDLNRTDFSGEDDMVDMETVIEAIAADTVDLLGISWGGAPVLTYAARHADRVRRMVLYGTGSAGRDHLVAVQVDDRRHASVQHRRYQRRSSLVRQVQRPARDHRVHQAEHGGRAIVFHALIEAVVAHTVLHERVVIAVDHVHLARPPVIRVHALAHEVADIVGSPRPHDDLPVRHHQFTGAEKQIVVAQVPVADRVRWLRHRVLDGDNLRREPLRHAHRL